MIFRESEKKNIFPPKMATLFHHPSLRFYHFRGGSRFSVARLSSNPPGPALCRPWPTVHKSRKTRVKYYLRPEKIKNFINVRTIRNSYQNNSLP